jgi:hypothetical protein
MVLLYLLSIYKNRPNFPHGDNEHCYIAFDDMCHLRRLVESKRTLHNTLEKLLEQVRDCCHKV